MSCDFLATLFRLCQCYIIYSHANICMSLAVWTSASLNVLLTSLTTPEKFYSFSFTANDTRLASLHSTLSLTPHPLLNVFVFQCRKHMWYPGIIWGCVIIIALLPVPYSHGFSCLVSSMPILWLDLLSSWAKNTKITIFPPLICSVLVLWSLLHCLLLPTATRLPERMFSWAAHYNLPLNFIT